VAFGTTLVLNFGLNRAAFRSKGLIGRALLRYIVLVVADWLVTLAVTTGMTALGTPYVVARTEATVFAAAVNYIGYRWWVFRT
jgi:putative flippase GtrA